MEKQKTWKHFDQRTWWERGLNSQTQSRSMSRAQNKSETTRQCHTTHLEDCCISRSALKMPSHRMITCERAEVQGEPIPLRSRKERDTACWLWVGWIRAERRAASGRHCRPDSRQPASLTRPWLTWLCCTPQLLLRLYSLTRFCFSHQYMIPSLIIHFSSSLKCAHRKQAMTSVGVGQRMV